MERQTDSVTREQKLKDIEARIKTYPDFPKPGIVFKDVFPLFHHPSLLPSLVDLFVERITSQYQGLKVDMIVGMDSRGFLFGPEIARALNCDFIPARKKGKLPGETVEESYNLEYGSCTVEMQIKDLVEGKSAIIVDDLVATGGTMTAVYNLLTNAKVNVLECQCVIELSELRGKEKLPKDCPFFSLVQC